MAAHNETFPWTSYYGHYNYFEEQMKYHRKVTSLTPEDNGAYELTRTQGDTLRVFICECYAFGVAEYMETIEQLGKIDAVIINSAWCGYTPDCKRHCRDSKVGIFKIGEFMSALHRDDYWRYLTEAEEEYFKKQGWL
jgi:hypothetical protein